MAGSFIVQQSGRYHIAITDTEGQSNSEPIEYSVNALADQPPRISIVKPGRDFKFGKGIAGLAITHRRDDAVVIVDMGGGYGNLPYDQLKDDKLKAGAPAAKNEALSEPPPLGVPGKLVLICLVMSFGTGCSQRDKYSYECKNPAPEILATRPVPLS